MSQAAALPGTMPDARDLTLLGHAAAIPDSPEQAVLERVANPDPDATYLVRFACPEFTSLCPVTGQPDFAHLVIDYVPGEWLVESKSLKLFLASFRNQGPVAAGPGCRSLSRAVAQAASSAPRSSLTMPSIAVATRAARARSGPAISSPRRLGTTCQHTP